MQEMKNAMNKEQLRKNYNKAKIIGNSEPKKKMQKRK